MWPTGGGSSAQATVPSPPPRQRASYPLPRLQLSPLSGPGPSHSLPQGTPRSSRRWGQATRERLPGSGVEVGSVQTGSMGSGQDVCACARVYREARVSCKQVSCRRNHAYQLTPAQPRRPGTGGAVASPAILLILSHPGPVLTSGCSPLCRGPWLCPSACHLQPCACLQRWVRSRGPRPLTEQERGSPSAQQDRGKWLPDAPRSSPSAIGGRGALHPASQAMRV